MKRRKNKEEERRLRPLRDEEARLRLLKKFEHPRPPFRLFSVIFKLKMQILQQINVKNVPPVIGARIRTHNLLIMSLL